MKRFEEYIKSEPTIEKYPDIQIFVQIINYKLKKKELRIASAGKCKVSDDVVMVKDSYLYISKSLFGKICFDCGFGKSQIANIKRNLYMRGFLKTYGAGKEYLVDLWIPSMKKKYPMYAISQKILDYKGGDSYGCK